MTTIQVTGGYADYVVAEITERDDQDLSGAEFKARLLDIDLDDPPAFDSEDWQDVSVSFPGTGKASVSLLVSGDDYEPGRYHLWVVIEDNPTISVARASNVVVLVR